MSVYSVELFDKLKQISFKPCELDSNKIKSYLDQVNSSHKIKPYIKLILSQTVRIPTLTVCENLRKMTIDYLSDPSNIRPNYVYLPKKIGSEQYFFSQIYDLFPEISIPKNIITGYKLDPLIYTDQINLLIVDDGSFSGNNTIGKIDEISYANKKIIINYIVIIPYQLVPIDTILYNTRFSPEQASRISLINVQGFIKPPHVSIDHYILGNELAIISTCFFDHKVPNEFGSWPQIYLEGHLYNRNTPFGNLFVESQIPTKQPILDIFDLT